MAAFIQTPTIFNLTDDSGFLAIVNADSYMSFVGEDWGVEQLLNHFVGEMNNDALIIWATAMENEWVVSFSDMPSSERAYKEFSKTIEVTCGKLYLTNFEDLTMAAQYADEKIPAKHNAGLYITLDNGVYNFRIRQMFNADEYCNNKMKVDFEIVIQPENIRTGEKIKHVFWRN